MQRKRVHVSWEDKPLSRKERRNFSKTHPGERLSFQLRFPYFPEVIAITSIVLVLIEPLLHDILLQLLSRLL